MAKFLKVSQVETILANTDSKSIGVIFQKVDGTLADKSGLPKVHKRLVGGARGEAASATLKAQNRFYLAPANPAGHGCSFYKDKVTQIRAMGEVFTPHNVKDKLAALGLG